MTPTKSGVYKIGENGTSLWAFVFNKLGAVAAICSSLLIIFGALAGGVRLANRLDRPQTEQVVREVLTPYLKEMEESKLKYVERSDFDSYRWKKDAKDETRDADVKQIRADMEYMRKRLDQTLDAIAVERRDRRGG